MALGIERIGIWPATMRLDIEALSEDRGLDHPTVARSLGTVERSVCPPWEDTVTMAVNAADQVLDDDVRGSVELLIAATESAVDQEKPVSSWAHRWLGTPGHCRNFEIKHACYAGTAGVRMALAWLKEQGDRPVRALVLGADLSLLGFNEPYEPVMGACGFALLLSNRPQFLEIDPVRCGVYAAEVTDVIRPALTVETGNSETSLLAYLDALEGAYADFDRRTGGTVDFDAAFHRHIYHLPFAGMGLQAHRTLAAVAMGLSRKDATAHFERKVAPSIRYSARIGSSYSASTFIALLSLLDHDPEVHAGDPVSLFSYGSGSCAEFYSARLGERCREIATTVALGDTLNARRPLSVAAYEASEAQRVGAIGAETFEPDLALVPEWHGERYAGRGHLTLERIQGHARIYRRA
ncbi:MAG: hydroxymethylglutaryl-CoA synthase [Pseudomonadota bacterium]